MKKNVFFCVLGLCAMSIAAFTVTAETFTIKDGTSDWNSPDSYSGAGSNVPKAGDTVVIPANTAVTVNSDDEASAAIVSKLGNIKPENGSTSKITFNVSEGDTLTITGTIWRVTAGMGLGVVVKKGLGTLVLDAKGATYQGRDYYTERLEVHEGTLVAPQHYTYSADGAATYWGASYGHVVVSNSATFKLPYGLKSNKDKYVQFLSLAGGGAIVSDSPDTQLRLYYAQYYDGLCTFSGAFGQNVSLFNQRGLYLTGTASTMTSAVRVYNGLGGFGDGARGVIGVMKFGKKSDSQSSVGVNSQLNFDSNGGVFKYLGTGEETDKDFYVMTCSNDRLSVIDGGPNGGLVVSGGLIVSDAVPPANNLRFGLSGDGPYTNVLKGAVRSWTSATGLSTFAFEKRGAGTWRFADCIATEGNAARSIHGSYAVREGTLQFDSLTKRGEFSSLGTASHLFEPWAVDNEHVTSVDWAFLLGGTNEQGVASAEGVLDYVGRTAMSAETRPFCLLGNGALCNSSDRQAFFRALPPCTTGAKTLTLRGDGAAESRVADVTDTEDSPLSVVKEGTGTWVLCGNQDFHGSLSVDAGTLIVRKPPRDFTYFRFTVKEMFDEWDGSVPASKANMSIRFLGLFDADGNVQTKDLVLADGTSGAALAAGEVALDIPREIIRGGASYGSTKAGPYVTNLFCFAGSYFLDMSMRNRESTVSVSPTPSDPLTWIPFVFRLRENATTVASYDWATLYGRNSASCAGYKWNPRRWSLEGSVDGINWEDVNPDGGDFVADPDAQPGLKNDNYFVYSGASYQVSVTSASPMSPLCHTGGCSIRGVATNEVSVLNHVGTVRVAPDACLKAEGDDIGSIRKLVVDASRQGTGVIDGFTIATEGEITIENMPRFVKELALPIEFRNCQVDMGNWSIKAGGQPVASRYLAVRDGRLYAISRGMIMIVR